MTAAAGVRTSSDGRRFAFTRVVNLGCGQCDVSFPAFGELGSSSVRQPTIAATSPSWSPKK
jgi:hypothetical protein